MTAALVVALGTVTGIAALTASSAYDYRLESEQLQLMNSMRGICVGDCLAQAQRSTLGTQVKAVLLVSGFILVTNLLLVAWVAAVKGGRLNLTSVTHADGPSDAGAGARSRAQSLRLVLAAGLIGSATIHAAVVPDQLTDWTAAGVYFIALTAAEVGAAVLVQASQRRATLLAAVVVSIVPLILWIYSRAAGLPFGPHAGVPEPVGIPDIICGLLEIVTLVFALVLLRSADSLQRTPLAWSHVRALAVVAVIAVTALGFATTVPAWFDAANPDAQPGVSSPTDADYVAGRSTGQRQAARPTIPTSGALSTAQSADSGRHDRYPTRRATADPGCHPARLPAFENRNNRSRPYSRHRLVEGLSFRNGLWPPSSDWELPVTRSAQHRPKCCSRKPTLLTPQHRLDAGNLASCVP